jgi:DNA-binding NarL/FixJ family response regulator
MIRVLLADDHEIVRAGLRLLVDAQSDMQVIAEASTGNDAIACVRAERPDVAVLDLTMPGLGGLGAAQALQFGAGTTRLVIFTRHDDEAYLRELLAVGANGYVLKQSNSSELLEAIRAAARGDRYIDASLRRYDKPDRSRPGARPIVSNRERDVLRLTAIGHSNKEIASQLGISVKTVEVHKSNAMHKLHLLGRTDVVRYAVMHGWMKDP